MSNAWSCGRDDDDDDDEHDDDDNKPEGSVVHNG